MPRPPLRVLRIAALACLCAAVAPHAQPVAPQAQTAGGDLTTLRALRGDGDGDGVPDRVGERVVVTGRVTAGTGLIRAGLGEAYIQDGTGGLRLVFPPDADAVLTGDSLRLAGTLAFRDGMLELQNPEVRALPGPAREIEPARLHPNKRPDGSSGPDIEGHEGELVSVEGRVLELEEIPGGRVMVLLSGTDLVQVFAYTLRPAPVSFDAVRIGDYARVRGIAAQYDREPPYDGSYLVYPLVDGDVKKAGLSPTEYRNGALGIGGLLLIAVLWAALLRRQVRKRSEALRASEVRYGHLFNAAADPVLLLDASRGGEVIEANRAAQRAFGIDINGDRPDGRSVRLGQLAADEEEATLHLAEADQKGAATGVLELTWADHSHVPYEIVTRRLREGRTFVAIARNVTERRAYEHGLLSAISAAEEAREQAEEAARLKSAILANMSHEIRTPLTAILGFADILREEVADDLYEYADTIRTGGQRLLDTLNDILDYARLDSERAGVLPEPIDAAVVVRESVALLAPLAKQKGLGLHLQSTASTVPATHSEPALGRVVTNLVGNAIKFTERGEVRVSLHAAPDFFAVRVQDTGVGISEAFLPELYEAFKQESDGHGRDFEGTGLGLAITRRLVDLMGGEIRVWSQKGEGTLFEVALPLHAPNADVPDAPSEIPHIPSPEELGATREAAPIGPSPHAATTAFGVPA